MLFEFLRIAIELLIVYAVANQIDKIESPILRMIGFAILLFFAYILFGIIVIPFVPMFFLFFW